MPTAAKIAPRIVRNALAPFYRGMGDFDHAGMLDEFERRAGRAFTERELGSLGRVVAAYVVERDEQALAQLEDSAFSEDYA